MRHHVNVHGEDLIFWQRRGERFATRLHSDLDWHPKYVGPENFHPLGRPGLFPAVPVVADTTLNEGQAQWLAACFDAAQWAREPAVGGPPPHQLGESDAEARTEALSKPWDEMSDKARRIVTFYLVEEVRVESPALPIDEQFRITWVPAEPRSPRRNGAT